LSVVQTKFASPFLTKTERFERTGTLGVGGAGTVTVMVALALAVPPLPVQLRV